MSTTKRQQKRADIARSAIQPLSELGMRNVTLTDLGRKLGMSGAHLLYYFESKNDLGMAALRMVEQDWQALLAGTLRYAVDTGELPDTVDVDQIAEGVSALLDGLTIRVVVGDRPLDHDAAMRVVHQFTAPLLPWQEPTDAKGNQ